MRPGVLSGLGWLLIVPALYINAFQWVTLRKLRDSWRGSEALSGELDQSLACDLVSDHIAHDEYRRHVTCEGELISLGEVARLSNVKVDSEYRTYCLARAPRWQVLRAVRNMPCFATRPPDLSRPVESERERVIATSSTQVTERLDAVRAAMASDDRPSKCPQRTRTHGGAVPVLEYELLQGGEGDPAWSFLSTPWLQVAVVKGGISLSEASDRWEGRPWVAVITSQSRQAARVGNLLTPWTRGELTGTLSLIDAAAGELLCEVPFAFGSSVAIKQAPKPRTGSRLDRIVAPSLDFETDDQIQQDFKSRYETELVRALNEMTGYGVRPSMY